MLDIRPAKKCDIEHIAALIYSAGPDLYDFIYKTGDKIATDYIRYEFNSGRGFCGYKNVTVAVRDGQVVATGCFYGGAVYKNLFMGTVRNMFQFYGPVKIWPILLRSRHIGSVMAEPKKDELYLANFGVSPERRGSGIGAAMLRDKIDFAKSAGYKVFSLDVSDRNPRAEALYLKHGLKVVKHNKFAGRRAGTDAPDSKKMELALDD